MTENNCIFPYADKFANGDRIISRSSGDMGIFDRIDKRGYVHFKQYVGGMFHKPKDVKDFTLQSNYMRLYELCSKDEEKELERILTDGRS